MAVTYRQMQEADARRRLGIPPPSAAGSSPSPQNFVTREEFLAAVDGVGDDSPVETRLHALELSSADHYASSLLHPQQLGYIEITAAQTTTSTSLVDVTGLTRTVTVGARPVRVTLSLPVGVQSSVAADVYQLAVLRGSTVIGSIAGTQSSAGGSGGPFAVPFHDNPGAGTHTYKVQVRRFSGSGTITVNALGTPFFAYPSLRVEEVAA